MEREGKPELNSDGTTGPGVLDATFFLPELRKLVNIFSLAQQTIASTLARKSVLLVETLMARAQQANERGEPAPKRKPGTRPKANSSPDITTTDHLKHPVRPSHHTSEHTLSNQRDLTCLIAL